VALLTVTGTVHVVENTKDPEGICQISDEYWVLVTPTDRFVLVGARDPIYASEVSIYDARQEFRSRVGKTITVEGQLMSLQMRDFVCTWLRPSAIYD
jgi:hypothetical protein